MHAVTELAIGVGYVVGGALAFIGALVVAFVVVDRIRYQQEDLEHVRAERRAQFRR